MKIAHIHDLIVIYQNGPEIEETVVRWCCKCGAIVVDIDSDGRTMKPGGYMSMILPAIAKDSTK